MLYIDQYRLAVPFDPLDMTGLEIWLQGSRVTLTGTAIDKLLNDGTLGDAFEPSLGGIKAQVGTPINGEATASVIGSSVYTSGVIGRWLTDDAYDIYVVVKAAAQTNKAILSQHNNTATIGRCVWGTADDGVGSKPRMFFNNGTNRIGNSTVVAFDNTPHVIRWHSTGAGNHFIQVDGGTDELVITGQTFTPMNTPTRLFAIDGALHFTGTIAEVLGCDTVQTALVAAAANAYLMDKYGI